MALTVRAGVVGLLLSVAPAWAADFSAELDFVTRASNSNLFATAEFAASARTDPRPSAEGLRAPDAR